MSDFTAKLPTTGPAALEVSLARTHDTSFADDELSTLVDACQRGDRDGQSALFERFHVGVFRMAVRMVGQDDADDLVQQVFMHTFQKINQFAGRSRFDTWLYRVTVNECLQLIRRRKPTSHLKQGYEPAAQQPAHTEQYEQQELMDAALGRLDPDLRAIFLLREVEGRNYAEIAESLEIFAGTVASRLNRARRQLKEYLVDLGWEP